MLAVFILSLTITYWCNLAVEVPLFVDFLRIVTPDKEILKLCIESLPHLRREFLMSFFITLSVARNNQTNKDRRN